MSSDKDTGSSFIYATLRNTPMPECVDLLVHGQIYEKHVKHKGKHIRIQSLMGYLPGHKRNLGKINSSVFLMMKDLKKKDKDLYEKVCKASIKFLSERQAFFDTHNSSSDITPFGIRSLNVHSFQVWHDEVHESIICGLKINKLYSDSTGHMNFASFRSCGNQLEVVKSLFLAIPVCMISAVVPESICIDLFTFFSGSQIAGPELLKPMLNLMYTHLYDLRFKRSYEFHKKVTEAAKILVEKHNNMIAEISIL